MKSSIYMSEKTQKMYEVFSGTLKSKKTKEVYWNLLCLMCDLAMKDFSEYTKQDFIAFADYFEERVKSGKNMYSTYYNRLTIASSIANFAEANKSTFKYPASFENHLVDVEKPQYTGVFSAEKAVPLDQLDALLNTAAGIDFTMYVVIALVAKCGLTVTEICNLKKSNLVVDAKNRLGIVFQQQPQNKYIRIHDDVAEILVQLMTFRPPVDDYILTNNLSKPFSQRTLEYRFKTIVNKALPGKKVTLQSLRSTAALRMLKAGASDVAVAEYLGITTKWINRYNRAIEQFDETPLDYVNLSIKKNKVLDGLSPFEHRNADNGPDNSKV